MAFVVGSSEAKRLIVDVFLYQSVYPLNASVAFM